MFICCFRITDRCPKAAERNLQMDYVRMGQRIRKQRKLMGLTQKAAAEKTGISLPFYGHIERGSRKASLETLVSIANALGVSMDAILQDSLVVTRGPFPSEAYLSEHSRALLNDIVNVLREHDAPQEP